MKMCSKEAPESRQLSYRLVAVAPSSDFVWRVLSAMPFIGLFAAYV